MASRTARKGTSRYKIRDWKQYEAALVHKSKNFYGFKILAYK